MNVTIQEEFTLPSKGLVYRKPIDPNIKLRSMTVAEEMKRLSPTDTPYKTMSEIIDDCMLTKLPISTYDLCLGDYIYLLHRLRVVTYGPDYTIQYLCPYCGNIEKEVVNLDDLKIKEYSKDINDMFNITLPKSGKNVKLRLQTPRDLDEIATKVKDMKKKFPEMTSDPTIILTLQSLIDEIDGEPVNPITIGESLKQLPAMDYNYLSQKATKLNEKVGIDVIMTLQCKSCKNDVNTTFRYTDEFFRPAID